MAKRKFLRAIAYFRLGYFLPWLVLVVALGATQQLWRGAQQEIVKDAQANFDSHLARRMRTYEQMLRGVDGLLGSADRPNAAVFRDYVDKLHLKENCPGVQAVGFAQIVLPAEKGRHIAAIRKTGFPEYAVVPEGERNTYSPVIYIEPFDERNRHVFGYDMYSDL